MAPPTSLNELHTRLGARFGEVHGSSVPLDYGDSAAEHQAVRQRVGVVDRSERGTVQAAGRDRASFLHGMLSSDVKGLVPGQGGPATLLNAHGRILALLTVHCLADRLLLEMDRELVAPTLATLDRFLISERVELEDASEALGIVTLAGPGARAAVEKALEAPVPELAVFHHAVLAADGADVRIVRSDETGEEGYDLWTGREVLSRLWERALAAGAVPVGRAAWDLLRFEAGAIRYGVDVDATTLVMEAPLEHAYSVTKGCYVGQEVIARVTYRGHVNRKLVGLVLADARVPAAGAAIRVGGTDVGRVTSAAVSPTLGRGIALGFVRREHSVPGTEVEVTGEGALLRARVAALPFYRRA